jgi:hypothetical protein
MAVIEIEDKLAKALRAQAAVSDMTLETFLKRIAEIATPIHPAAEFLPDEFDRSIADGFIRIAGTSWRFFPR